MNHIRFCAIAAVIACAAGAHAQTTQLTPPAARITDTAIQADHRGYEAVQGRIKALNDKGRPVRDYHLSKAQCWLDVSFHEYTRNDRSAFPQAALTESEKLVQGMERGDTLGFDTPLVNDAARLRPDLWDKAQALRGHAGYKCAQQKAACAEVELVHAGNEYNQQQWRHAKPYVQIAEDLIGEGEALAASCVPPPAPIVVAAPPAPPPAAMPVPAPLIANVVFAFDRHTERDMRGTSAGDLDAAAARIKAENLKLVAVRLIGHADLLNSTGSADYNVKLSKKRVETVRRYLVQRGLADSLVTTDYKGDSTQVKACPQAHYKTKAALQECLLPNRRVEVQFVFAGG